MASQAKLQPVVLQCPAVDNGAVIRAAAISGACSATFVLAMFVLISWIRRRRASQAATATAAAPPPPPPPPSESPAPPRCIYCYNAPEYYAPPPPLYAPPLMYAPPTPSWPNVTFVNNNADGDIEMAALGYAATAGTTAAAACIMM